MDEQPNPQWVGTLVAAIDRLTEAVLLEVERKRLGRSDGVVLPAGEPYDTGTGL